MYRQYNTVRTATRRQRITDALIEMMQEADFENISVSSLCEFAGVPRRAFYRYFSSKEDMISAVLDTLRNTYNDYVRQRNIASMEIEERLTVFFQFWEENKRILKAFSGKRLSGELIEHTIETCMAEGKGSRLHVRFTVTGLYGVLVEWARSGFAESPEQIAFEVKGIFLRPLEDIFSVIC